MRWELFEGVPDEDVQHLSRVYGGAGGEQAIPVTQEQLAALAGASRATVNAVLSAERRRGTIEVRRGATLVRDHNALARRAGLHATGERA